MGRTWGRLYCNTRNHRKLVALQRKHPRRWWVFYPLLEMAFETHDEGKIYVTSNLPFTIGEVADQIRVPWRKLIPVLETMRSLELINFSLLSDQTNGNLTKKLPIFLQFTSYLERQFKSDCVTERTRQFKEKQRVEAQGERSPEQPPAVPGNGPEEKRGETDKDVGVLSKDNTLGKGDPALAALGGDGQDEIPPASPPEKPKKVRKARKITARQIVDLWNEIDPIPGMEPVELFEERKRKIDSRLTFRDDLEYWRKIFMKVKGNPFLRGEKGWKATLDWIMNNNLNGKKIYEGQYDDRGNQNTRANRQGSGRDGAVCDGGEGEGKFSRRTDSTTIEVGD